MKVMLDDGRIIKGTFVTESLTSGYGNGEDQYGNQVQFKFGMDEEEVDGIVKAELSKAKNRPPLKGAAAPATKPILFRQVHGN